MEQVIVLVLRPAEEMV
jgi:hypothetical protein